MIVSESNTMCCGLVVTVLVLFAHANGEAPIRSQDFTCTVKILILAAVTS